MKIIFDFREKELINHSKKYIETHNLSHIEILVERLDIGDIIIKNDEKELLIIERKSIKDLMSSIKDGRYKEQSYRLNAYNIHNHNIIYLIEGITSGFGYIPDNRVNINTIYSSMCELLCYKGYSLLKTNSINESCEIIIRFADKIYRNNKDLYYFLSSDNNESINEIEVEPYCSTIKKVKSNNINIENIGEIMLCQIPKISGNIAHKIMTKYKTIKNIINSYQENNNILEEFTYENDKNQIKKLTKPAIENIKKYLFYT